MNNQAAALLVDRLKDLGLSAPFYPDFYPNSPFFVFLLKSQKERAGDVFPDQINLVYPEAQRVRRVFEVIIDFRAPTYDPKAVYTRLKQTAVWVGDWDNFIQKKSPYPNLLWQPLVDFTDRGVPGSSCLALPEWLEFEWNRLGYEGEAVPRLR